MHPMTRVVAAVTLLLAAACAELPPAPDAFEFELTGRIAARYRDEASSGTLAWRHRAARDDVLLSSPFGQGLARITRDGEAVTLVTGDGKRYTAADAPAQTAYAQDGRLLSLEQHGWRIEYTSYEGARPKVLKLNYPGLELRLAISEWK